MKRTERGSEEDEFSDDLDAVNLLAGLSPKKAKAKKSASNAKLSRSYSRKEKSLGLLATRFVKMCKELDNGLISLDAASKTLSVVRRRIYDVVNVLQSIGIVERRGKNTYGWCGSRGMRAMMAEIRSGAQNGDDADGATKRGESLGVLSRRFVSLFLESEEGTVLSLESAALGMQKRDATPDSRPGATKTKVRRLYDVANIFSAIGVIVKERVPGARKPSFVWNKNSPLLKGDAEFFEFLKNEYGDDDFDGGEGACADECENEDEEEVMMPLKKKERFTTDAGSAAGAQDSARAGKRKLFDRDEEATAPSSSELMAIIQANAIKQEPGTTAAAVQQQHLAQQQENKSNLAMPSGRGIKFPTIKKEFNSPQVKKQHMANIASPETEKTVASLLLTFGSGPLFA